MTRMPRALAMASRVLNLGVCSPFSSRTSVTRPMFAAWASDSCVNPADSLNWRMRSPRVCLPRMAIVLDGGSIVWVTIVTGEVPGNLDPIPVVGLQDHFVRIRQLKAGHGRTLFDFRNLGVRYETFGTIREA